MTVSPNIVIMTKDELQAVKNEAAGGEPAMPF